MIFVYLSNLFPFFFFLFLFSLFPNSPLFSLSLFLSGGDKYIANNILFKFAVDSHGLFHGSDYAASKVAGHELKGLKAYFSLGLGERKRKEREREERRKTKKIYYFLFLFWDKNTKFIHYYFLFISFFILLLNILILIYYFFILLEMTELRVPIMALVDYRGFRLIAISVLPVSGKSLVCFFFFLIFLLLLNCLIGFFCG